RISESQSSGRASRGPVGSIRATGYQFRAMTPDEELDPGRKGRNGGLLMLTLLACIVGAGAGAIGALFRLSLLHADAWRNALIAWSHTTPIVGSVLVTLSCAVAVAVAAWLVRRYSPEASGSGIPHVDAVV